MHWIKQVSEHYNRKFSKAIEEHPDNLDVQHYWFTAMCALNDLERIIKKIETEQPQTKQHESNYYSG
jgi:hypothetical protein